MSQDCKTPDTDISAHNVAEPSPSKRGLSISIGALRAFVAVVEQGNFSKAAQQLGMTQPNVSNQISVLEAACGLRLLHRRTANQVLTDAGRDLYARARLVLSRMDDFEALATNFSDLRRGKIVIGFSTPPIALRSIGAFMRAHPEVAVQTRLGNTASLMQDITECRVDVALLSLLSPDAAFFCHLIAHQSLNLIVPAGHDLARRKSAPLSVLAQNPFVSREPGSVTRALTEIAFERAGAAFRPVLEVASREAVKEAVANEVALGFVLQGEIGEDARIKALPIPDLHDKAGVYLVSLRESQEIPAVAAFCAIATVEAVI
jgi:DNA-binding transcriptional LysR family regulator